MFTSLTEEIYIEAINRIKKQVKGLESDFIDMLIDFIVSLDSKGGFLLKETANKRKAGRLDTLIERYLKKSGYVKSVTRFLEDFDLIDDEVRRAHSEVNNYNVPKGLITPHKKAAITRTTSDLVGNGLTVALKDPIKIILFDAVTTGGSLTDVMKEVRTAIKTTQGKNGRLLSYVTQISRDALQQYNGRLHGSIQRELKLNAYLYVNSLVKDSRPQCIRWHDMETILIKDLKKEIEWAKRNGKGMIPETTVATFSKYRGGFACRHEAIPTKVRK